ncbi:MAG TPA: penicillin acylase family protein [Stellaceae bacterium]|nr:penicillin acylase family protein [Stellaceae bacterium]
MRVVRHLLAGAVLLVLLLAGAGFLYLRSSLPQIDGSIAVAGLGGAVTIARDADGVPLITAADDSGAAFGLGFAHAQDRLFQMELMRRAGAGRLAEIFGEQAVANDRQMRVLGLYHLAEAELSLLSAPLRRALEAYTAGVNAFLETRSGALPPEFLLLRFAPEPWRPADSLVWGKLMDLRLAGNYRSELLRARLARTLSPAELAFLYPQYPKDAPTTLAGLTQLYRRLPLDRLYAALPPLGTLGPIRASNNWVVDGAHSASGKPLLANDPHLEFAAPGVWYLARLRTPGREIAGATAPGAPFVVVGHSDTLAWGFTNTGSDVEDLFIEKIDPSDPGRYLTPGGSDAFATRQETITVRDAAPVRLTVRTTRHGPILSDALPVGAAAPGYVLALSASFLSPDDTTPDALWGIGRAVDANGFRDALKSWVAPQQNIVYADSGGTIGFIAPGRVPIRKSGDGWLPAPGWSGDHDWTGYIPFADLPQASNPASGHFVSANNKIVPDTYRYFLSHDWDTPNRAQRITELLAATPRQTPAASAAIQADTLSLAARRLVPLMTRIAPQSAVARDAVARLRGWDFRMDTGEVAPLLFTAWLRAFARDMFAAHLGAAAADYWDLKPQIVEAVLTAHPEWCAPQNGPHPDPPPQAGEGQGGGPPGKITAPTESCDRLLAAALDAALRDLARAYGPDIAQWTWGRAHPAVFASPLWSRIPVLRDWLQSRAPVGGGIDTVNRGATTIRDDAHPYEERFGAGLRIITDLASPEDSRMIAVPGQSGNPLSTHFADLVERWRRFGWLVPGRAAALATLRLEPAR